MAFLGDVIVCAVMKLGHSVIPSLQYLVCIALPYDLVGIVFMRCSVDEEVVILLSYQCGAI